MDRNISVLRVKSFFESQIVEATKYYHEKLSREDLPFEERTLYQGALKALQILKRNYAISFPEILVIQVDNQAPSSNLEKKL